MALQLHCKRSKLFMRPATESGGKRTERITCARGDITTVPDWVRDTTAYTLGIYDKSIVDLSAPRIAGESAPTLSALMEENSMLRLKLAKLEGGKDVEPLKVPEAAVVVDTIEPDDAVKAPASKKASVKPKGF